MPDREKYKEMVHLFLKALFLYAKIGCRCQKCLYLQKVDLDVIDFGVDFACAMIISVASFAYELA